MSGFSAKLEGLEDFMRSLAQAPEVIAAHAESVVRSSGKVVQSKVKTRAPRRTKGRPAKGVRRKSTGRGAHAVTKVYLSGDPARVTELGAPPHRIGPKTKRALHFGGPRGPVVAAIEHPGAPSQPFFAEGVQDAQPDIDAAMDEAGAKIVQTLVR
jgi:hypothetical protein